MVHVQATGARTEMGKIGHAVTTLNIERTPLQVETDRLVRIFAVVGLAMCVLVVILYGTTRGSWLNGILAGLSLAVSMIPEEFPVVLTVFLALGAWRISRANVLTRRIPAIETLGAATVLCVDKTGTLTQNRMAVSRLWAAGESFAPRGSADGLPENFHRVVEFSILASRQDPFDPMEKAFVELGETFLRETEHLHVDWQLMREYPLSPELLAMSRAWLSPQTGGHIVAAKGAPEAIVRLCRLAGGEEAQILGASDDMAAEGLRVLGVAEAELVGADLPPTPQEIAFRFVGLVGLADPVASGVPDAIQEAQRAGIRVAMITGDYPATARHIASQVGLEHPDSIITGSQLDEMSDERMRELVRDVNVYARVVPEHR
jgi:Ca2+-transporting ATPase